MSHLQYCLFSTVPGFSRNRKPRNRVLNLESECWSAPAHYHCCTPLLLSASAVKPASTPRCCFAGRPWSHQRRLDYAAAVPSERGGLYLTCWLRSGRRQVVGLGRQRCRGRPRLFPISHVSGVAFLRSGPGGCHPCTLLTGCSASMSSTNGAGHRCRAPCGCSRPVETATRPMSGGCGGQHQRPRRLKLALPPRRAASRGGPSTGHPDGGLPVDGGG